MSENKRIGNSSDVRFTRSRDARRNFLAKKKGLFGSNLYVCAYCGKLVRKKNMEVDHCIPVHSAKTNVFVRNYIRLLGLFQSKEEREEGINGTWNLVAACSNCNGEKSSKTGFWIVRGIIGRYLFPALWYGASAIVLASLAQYLLHGTGLFVYVFKGIGYFGEGLIKLSNMLTI